MRRNFGKVLLLALAIGSSGSATAQALKNAVPAPRAAAGEPAPKAAPALPPPDPAKMKRLLEKWEEQSTKLKTLDVRINRVDRSSVWGDETYTGRAMMKAPNLAYLDFKKVEKNEKGVEKQDAFEQIRCTGTEVWQYRFETQQIFIYPLDKKDQRHALEEGPLPFLFNMKAAEAEKRYQMQLLREDEKSHIISVLPLLDIDKESFSKAFLQLDREYLLPTRIFLVSPDAKSTKDFTFTDIVANKSPEARNDKWYTGQLLAKPWEVVRNPTNSGKVVAPHGPARPPQPALRGNPPAGRR